jgi:RNA polymerase sigma-70 factor (ECF subfamily)
MMTSNPDSNIEAVKSDPVEPDVDDLVRRAQGGEAEAFDALVRIFSQRMYSLAYRMVGNHADASDLAQEIFIKLHKSIGKFTWKSSFSTWLYAVGSNTCRSGLRKIKRVSQREVVRLDREGDDERKPPEPQDPGDLPPEQMGRAELSASIQAAIDSLPEDFRMIVILRDVQNLSYEEVAEVLNCSMGTVKSRLARARTKLKDKLIRQGLVCAAKT